MMVKVEKASYPTHYRGFIKLKVNCMNKLEPVISHSQFVAHPI